MSNKLLALDQSSRVTGYTVLEDGKIIEVNHFECTGDDVGNRLAQFRKKIIYLIEEYDIDEIVFEDIQLQDVNGNKETGIKTFKVLAEVFGVIYELVNEMNIKNSAVLASEWKSTLKIKGYDRTAQKRAAQQYVIDNYNIKPTQDECDAICIGAHYYLKDKQEFDWSD